LTRAGAATLFKQARPLRANSKNPLAEAQTLSNIGLTDLASKNYSAAIRSFEQAIAMVKGTVDLLDTVTAHLNLASTYKEAGNNTASFNHLSEVLKICQAENLTGIEPYVRSALATYYADSGDVSAALDNARQAVELAEARRRATVATEMSVGYFSQEVFEYKTLISVLMKSHLKNPDRGYDREAFKISEAAKSRHLLDNVTLGLSDTAVSVNSGLLIKRAGLRKKIADLDERLEDFALTTQDQILLGQRRNAVLLEYQGIDSEIANQRGSNDDLFERSSARTLETVQTELLDSETVLIEYSLGATESYVWAVSRTGYVAVRLPPAAEIEALVANLLGFLRRGAEVGQVDGTIDRSAFNKYAAKLSEMILSPIYSWIGAKRLVIVSDGLLNYWPFPTLPVPRPSDGGAAYIPLVAKHEIVYLPSASVLAELRRKPAGCERSRRGISIVGDPVLGARGVRLSAGLSSRPLPAASSVTRAASQPEHMLFAVEEIARIGRYFGDGEISVASGFDAQREALTARQARDFQILHVATHTAIDDSRPELSKIELSSRDRNGKKTPHYLYAFEIAELNLPRELVVLSSCAGSGGAAREGEGLMSLARSFMGGGTKRVIGSLFPVRGEATSELMDRFYDQLIMNGRSPAAALQTAQSSMSSDPKWGGPENWGAFVLEGDWRGIPDVSTPGSSERTMLTQSPTNGQNMPVTYRLETNDLKERGTADALLRSGSPLSRYIKSRLSAHTTALLNERDTKTRLSFPWRI
jgi:CHAT domain-containing protein/tetratricopeptide (TPR) repeat protein